MSEPLYSSEYVDGAADVHRAGSSSPRCSPRGRRWTRTRSAPALAPVKGHRMAKAALRDGRARRRAARGRACRWPATSARSATGCRPASRSASWTRSPSCSTPSAATSTQGYLRIKLKIEPGWDVEPVRAVRERFGDDVLLQVDANTAYTLADARHLARLDPFDLLLIEQPLPEDDVRGHAELARRHRVRRSAWTSRSPRRGPPPTPSRWAPARSSTSSPAGSAATWRRGASTTCARPTACRCGAAACWRPGIGRAANVALAALPGFTLPGDTSASDRYYDQDITRPFVLEDGHLAVPTGPGIGVDPDRTRSRR